VTNAAVFKCPAFSLGSCVFSLIQNLLQCESDMDSTKIADTRM